MKAFAEAAIRVEFQEVRCAIGMGGDKLMPAVAGIQADSPRGQRISERRREIFKGEYLPHLRPFRDAGTFVSAIQASGLKTDIVHAALKKAGARASDALMIGDTPYDTKRPHAPASAPSHSGAAAGTTRGWRAQSPSTMVPGTCWRGSTGRRSQIPSPKAEFRRAPGSRSLIPDP